SYYLPMLGVPTVDALRGQVKRVRAGCYLWAVESGRRLDEKTYWSLADHASERAVSENDALEDLETRLRRAVKRRLVADVPVGCFLSGRIDSSLITLFASQESSSPIHSFSVDFEEPGYSEKKYFEYVANLAGTEQHVFTLNP